MMHSLNQISRYCYRPWLGLLLIRVGLGLIFVHHGWMKLDNIDGMVVFLGSVGIPAWLAYVVMTVELVGGAMLIAGILTRVAAVALGIVALVAFFLVVLPMRGVAGGELELLLAAGAFGIALVGSGRARLVHIFEHE